MPETAVKPPKVTVVEIKRNEKGGNLKAFVTIRIGPLEIYKCRLIQQPEQRGFVSPPQESWTDNQGNTKYFPLLKWPREWGDAITEAVVSAYEQG